jgi:hypothetical protein
MWSFLFVFVFETGSPYVTHVGLEVINFWSDGVIGLGHATGCIGLSKN